MENTLELVERLKSAAGHIVDILLAEQPEDRNRVFEASVHRSRCSRIWNAVFTGQGGGIGRKGRVVRLATMLRVGQMQLEKPQKAFNILYTKPWKRTRLTRFAKSRSSQ